VVEGTEGGGVGHKKEEKVQPLSCRMLVCLVVSKNSPLLVRVWCEGSFESRVGPDLMSPRPHGHRRFLQHPFCNVTCVDHLLRRKPYLVFGSLESQQGEKRILDAVYCLVAYFYNNTTKSIAVLVLSVQ